MRPLIFTLFIGLWYFTANGQYVNPYATGSTKNMVLIKGTMFWMGIDSAELNKALYRYPTNRDELLTEFPHYRVTLRDFYLDKYEVTNADFKKFIDANPKWSKEKASHNDVDSNYLKNWQGNKYPKGEGKYPVVYVSWVAAKAYAYWSGKRLPMEVEMEYASKYQGTTVSEYPWGNDGPDSSRANYAASNIRHTTAKGKYPPALGLYDMAGNVWEFCADNWNPHRQIYQALKPFSKEWDLYADVAVIKGGSFNSQAFDLRATRRSHCTKEACLPDLGFRCAMSYNISK